MNKVLRLAWSLWSSATETERPTTTTKQLAEEILLFTLAPRINNVDYQLAHLRVHTTHATRLAQSRLASCVVHASLLWV